MTFQWKQGSDDERMPGWGGGEYSGFEQQPDFVIIPDRSDPAGFFQFFFKFFLTGKKTYPEIFFQTSNFPGKNISQSISRTAQNVSLT